MLFRRGDTEVLALWSETGTEFASLKPAAPLRLARFDAFGNRSDLELDAAGAALPVTGRVQYLEGTGLEALAVARVQPVTVEPRRVDLVAGHQAELRCTVRNLFGERASFRIALEPAAAFAPAEPVTLDLARGEEKTASIALAAKRDAALGTQALVVTVTAPGGIPAALTAYAWVLPPVALAIEPFAASRIGQEPVPVTLVLGTREDRPLRGKVTLTVPEGMTATPAVTPFEALAPGGSIRMAAMLTSTRPPRPADALRVVAQLEDGAQVSLARALVPAVVDSDGNGLADGWQLNPQGSPDRPNAAEATIRPGDSEFHCQRVHCSRFGSGWIILHRDGQETIVKGRRYRIVFRARQEGFAGTVGVAVYNLRPWESCGLERQVRVGSDWQDFTAGFTATRDSDNARFEFYFTEVGSLFLEGMRLEETVGGR
jgi:hypothetical protein